ncbi:hypothetical protein [Bradyrhizobium sp. SRL28]|uniref:hypothetical protein n=1 Tax=Bradyrhizobium sp. SRL28 TaxID=2836178 RepID=UPI00201C9B38|nr:hypothetical protein [Bradyrhizobium sp. SRL28]
MDAVDLPNDNDETVYLVADDFGRLGRTWREADYEAIPGHRLQYRRALVGRCFRRVARELRRRCDLQGREPPAAISDSNGTRIAIGVS